MCNIAQIVNVLQSMILTDQKGTGHMVLTPTYHVFEMYKGFQEATWVPLDLQCGNTSASNGNSIAMVSASAAKKKDGSMIVALSNVMLDKSQEVNLKLDGFAAKSVTGRILNSKNITDYNDFEHTNVVAPKEVKDVKVKKDGISVKMPPQSIIVLNIK